MLVFVGVNQCPIREFTAEGVQLILAIRFCSLKTQSKTSLSKFDGYADLMSNCKLCPPRNIMLPVQLIARDF